MSRFLLVPLASHDIAQIKEWLDTLPQRPARNTSVAIRSPLKNLTQEPWLSLVDAEWSRVAGQGVRSRHVGNYRIYDFPGNNLPEVIAILHHARDASAILHDRLQ